MVTIVDGNVYITDGSVSGNTISGQTIVVTIHATKVDYIYDNAINILSIPISKGNTDPTNPTPPASATPSARGIDLKKIKETFMLTGVLENEPTERAIDKRNNLINLAKFKRPLTIVFGTGNYQTFWTPNSSASALTTYGSDGAFISRMQFSHDAGLYGDQDVSGDPSPEMKIGVTMTLVRAKDI